MLEVKTILENGGIKDGKKESVIEHQNSISYSKYKDACREYLLSKIGAEYTILSAEDKKALDISHVTDYVQQNRAAVEGFINEDNTIDYNRLIETLIRDLTDYGPLTPYLNDDSITEIQVNGIDAIWVERNGITELVKDSNGDNVRFESVDLMLTYTNKLINNEGEDNKKLSESNSLVNAISTHGYRVAVADKSVTPPGFAQINGRAYTLSIRKPSKSRFTFRDLINYGSITQECADFLSMINRANRKIFFVGATGSGKTSLINTVNESTSYETRTLVIQNPAEIDFTVRDEKGNVLNNVVHWEAVDSNKESDSIPTIKNCISHSLRFTPNKVIVGEVRKPHEFFELIREAMTGHVVMSSFHAESVRGAIDRAASEINPLVGDKDLAYRYVCTTMRFIVVQKKFKGGKRRIIEVGEVLGYDEVAHEPKIRYIFMFKPSGVTEFTDGTTTYAPGKQVKDIKGVLKKVGSISEESIREMLMEGITLEEIKPFADKEDLDKVVEQ